MTILFYELSQGLYRCIVIQSTFPVPAKLIWRDDLISLMLAEGDSESFGNWLSAQGSNYGHYKKEI